MLPNINHILYATDLSGSARKVMEYAVALADAFEASLSIIHVIKETSANAELLMAAFLGYQNKADLKQKSQGQVTMEIKNRLRQICDELGCQLPACRFKLAEVIVEVGHPLDIILSQAKRGPYDILVIGRHDYRLIEGAIRGHSTRGLLRDCPIPVFLVPISHRQEPDI
ncbi:MAG: universal stress protein [Desulfobacterales bacterium]